MKKENFLLRGDRFSDLKSLINFTEYRVYCTKPYHRRTQHAKFTTASLKIPSLFDYVTEIANKAPSNICDAIEYMPDDTSRTQTLPCTSMKPFSSGSMYGRLYNNIWYGHGNSHLNVIKALHCDDSSHDPGFDRSGTWLYYVR